MRLLSPFVPLFRELAKFAGSDGRHTLDVRTWRRAAYAAGRSRSDHFVRPRLSALRAMTVVIIIPADQQMHQSGGENRVR
jgi:hypothetical protein